MLRLGTVDRRQGLYEDAERKAVECRAFYESLGDRLGTARAIILLAAVTIVGSADHRPALQLQQQALAVVHEIGTRGTEAILLNDMGVVAYDLEDYAGAQRYYRAAGALGTGSATGWACSIRRSTWRTWP